MDRIAKLQRLVQSDEADSFVRHALALEYIKAGNDAEAVQVFTELLTLDPTYAGSYYHLGKAMDRIGERDRAIRTFKKGMEVAAAAGDNHTVNELRAACEEAEE